MIYNAKNAHGAAVFDVDAVDRIERVMSIDVAAGEVECARHPIRVNHLCEIETLKIRFRSIYPIFAGGVYHCLFHCYGREA